MATTATWVAKLAESVRAADVMLGPYRRNRRMFLRQYAGPYHLGRGGAAGSLAAEPLNMIHSVVSAVLPHLVAANPRAMVRSTTPALRRQAEVFELAWNHLAREIDLGRSLRAVVTDALFGAGIMKTGLAPAGVEAPRAEESHDGPGERPEAQTGALGRSGLPHDAGQPFADAVDVDDYVVDPQARRREEAAFEGNRYRLSRRYLLACGLFDRGLAERLPPAGGEAALEPSVELVDVWLPGRQAVVTIPGDPDGPRGVLREAPWEGPERGPYEVLGFHWVPGCPMPVPPVGVIFDLHVMINKVARRLARQADAAKDLVLYDQRAAEEAQALRDAPDGHMVGVLNVDRYRQVSFGGPGEDGYRHAAFLLEQFSRLGGNTDLLGGLSPQSDTLGQDQLLYASASVRIEDMRSQVYRFVKHVGEKLAWYLWYDPLADVPLERPDGAAAAGAARFSWRDRQGDWLDYHFDVEPHSLSPDTPARQYRRVIDWIQHVLLPTADLAAAQGLRLDVARLARLTGNMLNLPEAQDLFVRGERPPAEQETRNPNSETSTKHE